MQTNSPTVLKSLCLLVAAANAALAQTPFKELWNKPGIWSAAFSPDESMIAAGSSGTDHISTVFLLDTQDGSPLHSWPMGKIGVWDVQFAPQGRLLAATSGGRFVSVFGLSNRELLYSFGTKDQGAPIAFSPASSILAVADSGAISLYHSVSGEAIRSWSSGTNTQGLAGINAIAFLPDGKSLATGSGARGYNVALKLWDVETGAEIWSQPTAQTYGIDSISISADGESLASGSAHLHFPGALQIWQARTGTLLHTFPSPAFSAAFSPQAPAVLTVGTNLTLWSLPPRVLLEQKGGGSTVFRSQVRFSASGVRFLTASTTLRVFETPLVLVQPRLSDARLHLQWIGPANRYTLESSDLSASWTTYLLPATNAVIRVDPGARFFRLKR